MKRILTTLLILTAAFSFSQTNGTFQNLDVRNQAKVRSNLYLVPIASPPASAVVGMVYSDTDNWLYYYNGSTWATLLTTASNRNTLGWYSRKVGQDVQFKGVKTGNTFIDLLDSTTYIQFTLDTADLFNFITPPVYTVSNRNTEGLYSRTVGNDFQFRGIKSTDGYIDFLDSTTYLGFTIDTANLFDALPASPQYWTFVNSATDTLYNNVAKGTAPGVVQIKGNLELQTTKTDQTEGIIKQNGVNLIHTYHEKENNNLFIGQNAGNFTADSSYNIAIGKNTLLSLTTGYDNIAIGTGAGDAITTGFSNFAIGKDALSAETTGTANFAMGNNALKLHNFAGSTGGNTAVGIDVLAVNTAGYQNTGVGYGALTATLGHYNVGIGYQALSINTGGFNTGVGTQVLYSSKGNTSSTAIGYNAMYYADSRTSGRVTYNTAVGYEAMKGSNTAANNTGQYSTATGYQALLSMTDANYNSVYGATSGNAMTTGDFNTLYGYDAGGSLSTGDSNILIGTSAGAQLTTESDRLFIDNTNTTTPLIWGNFRSDSLRWNADVAFVKDLWYEDTYWRDATTSATALAPGVNAPSLRTIKGGIKGEGYAPSVQNDISYGQVQLNHDYKWDTDLSAHMHFMIEETGEAGDTAVFALEYAWADIDETFPTSDTLTILIPCAAITPLQHKLVEFGQITTPGGNNVSSSIIFRLERLQDSPHDTYDGANEYVIVLDVDYHMQIDAPGSRSEYLK